MTRAHSKIAFILDKSSTRHNISFNDTGFCSMLATILPSCKTTSKFINDKSNKGIFTQNTVYHDQNEIHNKVRFKRFFSKNQNQTSCPGFSDFRNAIDKHLNESISVHPYCQHGPLTTMFRASASLTGSINILPVDLVIDIRSINTLSL